MIGNNCTTFFSNAALKRERALKMKRANDFSRNSSHEHGLGVVFTGNGGRAGGSCDKGPVFLSVIFAKVHSCLVTVRSVTAVDDVLVYSFGSGSSGPILEGVGSLGAELIPLFSLQKQKHLAICAIIKVYFLLYHCDS